MTRDPIYDAVKAISKEKFDSDRAAFLEQAQKDDVGGWTKHSQYHWSRMVGAIRLDYWPSRKKWTWKGKTMRGDVNKFIRSKS